MLSLTSEEIFSELRRTNCVVAKLPRDVLPLLGQARKDLHGSVSTSRKGFAVPANGMPDSCLKLQTLPQLQRVFQACYVRDELVFSFDAAQYVPPGKRQVYRGLSASQTSDLVALVVLSGQKLRNGLLLDVGDVIFYYANRADEVFPEKNATLDAWTGLFVGFWPEMHDTYGVVQRQLMLSSGRCGLFDPSDPVAVPKCTSALDPETTSYIIGTHHVPHPELYVLNRKGRLERQRAEWKLAPASVVAAPKPAPVAASPAPVTAVVAAPKPAPVEVLLELHDLPIVELDKTPRAGETEQNHVSFAIALNPSLCTKRKGETHEPQVAVPSKKQRMEHLIEQLHEAMQKDTNVAQQLQMSSSEEEEDEEEEEEEVHKEDAAKEALLEIEFQHILEEIRQDAEEPMVEPIETPEDENFKEMLHELRQYSYDTPAHGVQTYASRLPHLYKRVDFPSRDVEYKQIADDGKTIYCKARAYDKLTEHVLYFRRKPFPCVDLEYTHRVFFRVGHDQTKYYEVRGTEEISAEDATTALRSLFCSKRGFLARKKSKNDCTGLLQIQDAEEGHLGEERLYKVAVLPGDKNNPCHLCAMRNLNEKEEEKKTAPRSKTTKPKSYSETDSYGHLQQKQQEQQQKQHYQEEVEKLCAKADENKENSSPRYTRALQIADRCLKKLMKSRPHTEWLYTVDIRDTVKKVCDAARVVGKAVWNFHEHPTVGEEQLKNEVFKVLHEAVVAVRLTHLRSDKQYGCMFPENLFTDVLLFDSDVFSDLFDQMYETVTLAS